MRIVDLRSDTVTKPTLKMREAMGKAVVGDDGFGEDPTVQRLEELASEILGKEAGLFLPSGTMANLVAVLVHTHPGDAVICDENAHLYKLALGGTATFAGVTIFPHRTDSMGRLEPAEIESTINLGPHFPKSTLIVIENTNNLAGGTILTPGETRQIADVAKKHGIPVHLDGARIFNSAMAQHVDAKELTKECDTVMFCLSKGLCCPVGSVLAGPKDFIERAKKVRKMLGGGMRQAGVIATCGIVALEEEDMIAGLEEDHKKARHLAEGLARILGPDAVNLDTVQTNIVCFNFSTEGLDCKDLVEVLAKKGVLTIHLYGSRGRMVTHHDVSRDDIDYALEVIEAVAAEIL
ncbi:MAG TPA: threonine aldolase family protein [Candidatus Avalokitesvara rifleensis]|uniref:threonine aldolase family protein n=1 Tax=Candidatus Avalokitesvara rifleensis TaxID=3367620 RepID=UPI00271267AA|nr:GntG family PLP-dependent aldolase [Candidatus Brocadiales bacterium]